MTHIVNPLLTSMLLLFATSQTILGEEADVSLQSLQLSEGPPEPGFMAHALAGELPEGRLVLTPAFDPGVSSYSVNVSQPLLTIRARASAGVKMDASGTASGGDELKVANRFSISNANDHGAFLSVTLSGLAAGENLVTVEVTNPEGAESRRYKVVLTRVAENAGDTAHGAKATKAQQARETAREAREKARVAHETSREAREKAREVRRKEREARAKERDARRKEREARRKEQRARTTDRSNDRKGHDLLSSLRNKDADGVRRAIEAGENVNEVLPGGTGVSPLLFAVDKESAEIVRLLVDAGADVNYTLPEQEFHSRSNSGISALLMAVNKENVEIVRLLIGAGADVNHVLPEQKFPRKSETGASALLLAVGSGNEEIVRLLINAGADLNHALPAQDFQSDKVPGTSALLLAVSKGQEGIVRLLIQGGADVNSAFSDEGFPARKSTGGVSALILAAYGGHEEIVRMLIEGGADIGYQVPGKPPTGKNPKTAGLTALRVAEAKDHDGIAELLRNAGAKR